MFRIYDSLYLTTIKFVDTEEEAKTYCKESYSPETHGNWPDKYEKRREDGTFEQEEVLKKRGI